MEFQNKIIEGNQINIYLNTSLYSKDAIFKCLYWYGDRFYTSVSEESGFYKIIVKPLPEHKLTEGELEGVLFKLQRDLIDFNLRDIVSKETQTIRELLIAKAFSHGEFDELPPGDISDPVGFYIR
jgi:His-Xaa-Ser system protein HxsD